MFLLALALSGNDQEQALKDDGSDDASQWELWVPAAQESVNSMAYRGQGVGA